MDSEGCFQLCSVTRAGHSDIDRYLLNIGIRVTQINLRVRNPIKSKYFLSVFLLWKRGKITLKTNPFY